MKFTAILLIIFALIVPASAESDSAQKEWQPYYTGDYNELPEIYQYMSSTPWGSSIRTYDPDAAYNSTLIVQGHTAERNLKEAFEKYGEQYDYGGCYINDSDTLTILLTEPTIERAELYGKNCQVGVWVIEADYTLAYLESALQEAVTLVSELLESENRASIGESAIAADKNRAYISISGDISLSDIENAVELPEGVVLTYETDFTY